MSACHVTRYEAETLGDCVSAIRSWREAVRDVGERFSTLRLNHERDCYAYLSTFHPSVIAEAEGYLQRSGR